MADIRSGRLRRLALGAATTVGILALALPWSVEAGASKVVPEPVPVPVPVTVWSPPPVPTAVREAFAVAADEPPAAAIPAEPAALSPPESNPCADALTWVEGIGLGLPPSVDYHCPSTQFPHHGAACWNGSPCRGSGFIAINMDLMQGTSTDYLRHVVAHEVCHIIDFQTTGRSTEAGADACAAAHGA